MIIYNSSDQGQTQPVSLKRLLRVMSKTVNVVTHLPTEIEVLPEDVEDLQELILERANLISHITEDLHLRAIIGSIFDTMTVEDIVDELDNWNNGIRPTWISGLD